MKKIERDLELLAKIRLIKNKIVRNKYPAIIEIEEQCLQRIREKNNSERNYLKIIS